MGNSDTQRNLLIAGAVFIVVLFVIQSIMPPLPKTPQENSVAETATSATPPKNVQESPTNEPGVVAEKPGDVTTEPPSAPTSSLTAEEAQTEETRYLGSPEHTGGDPGADPYRMRLKLTSLGAAVDSATLTDYAATVKGDERYTLLQPETLEDGVIERSFVVEKINLDGQLITLSDKNWNADPVAQTDVGQSVSFWINVDLTDQPVLRLRRIYELPKQPRNEGRHDLRSRFAIENLSQAPHKLIVTYRGGVGVDPTPGTRMVTRIIDWGMYKGEEDSRITGKRTDQRKLKKTPQEPVSLFKPTPEEPKAALDWAATANTYFTCTLAPLSEDGKDHPNTLASVSAVDLDGSSETDGDLAIRFVTRERKLDVGATVDYPADIYLGEKDHSAFREVDTYKNRNYYYQIAQGFGMCTFSWLVDLMIRLLNGLHFVVRDYGIAIIILVLIVRTLLHPITKKGQVNMARMQQKMQVLAPKIEEIKKKYANDKAKLNQEMMKLKLNPAGQLLTCLPMAIQMPIWVALFLSLGNNIQMRHQPFLFTWINDLTAPDALFTFSSPVTIPVVGWQVTTFNLLPILMAVFMYIQQKMQQQPTAPNPNLTDQQKQQQEMTKMMMPLMSVMMLLFFYKAPSGLNLYVMFSSLFGAIEQHRIRKHIKEREAAGTLHKSAEKKTPDDGLKKRRMPGFIERLQKMADEAQKAQIQKQDRKGKVRR